VIRAENTPELKFKKQDTFDNVEEDGLATYWKMTRKRGKGQQEIKKNSLWFSSASPG
jgi:hypothetical protein